MPKTGSIASIFDWEMFGLQLSVMRITDRGLRTGKQTEADNKEGLCWARQTGQDREGITWHVAHAAQNGPGYDVECLLSLGQTLVHQANNLIWAQVTSGGRESEINTQRTLQCIAMSHFFFYL